ncbi:hypothetical protein [Erwinia sorbitola]|uniref:Uncharacterized protein n=1 Tax=Erwinia sorbitola TaxID=2681984 RepID=A0A6I6F1Z3_9GAMM|nr:hypothetical protein [Erwinia sorbitola]QGU87930.1 hypothetical protein GN242_12135 [Erwinia sorbitola]
MAWEQVLLLLLYSRQFCYGEGSETRGTCILPRMKLIAITIQCCNEIAANDADKTTAFSLLHQILAWLDSGEGCFALVKNLIKESEQDPESKQSEAFGRLLHQIEQHAVTFPAYGYSKRPLYSHYALYKSLTDPIAAMQKLLATGDAVNDSLVPVIFSSIQKYLHDRYHTAPYHSFKHTLESEIYDAGKAIDSADGLADFCQRYPEAIEKKALLSMIKATLFEPFSWRVLDAFDLFAVPQNEKKNLSFTHSVFRDVCSISTHDQALQLGFRSGLLKNLIQLGLIDEVMKEVKEKLLHFAGGNTHEVWRADTPAQDYAQAFDQLDRWYYHGKTELFSSLDQLPKLIGSLIATDIKLRQGLFDDRLRVSPLSHLPARLSAQQIASLSTSLIHACLYRNNPAALLVTKAFSPPSLRSTAAAQKDLPAEQRLTQAIEEFILLVKHSSAGNGSGSVSEYNNKMMAEWADCSNIKSAVERIKKAHNYLLPLAGENIRGINAYRYILNQRSQGLTGTVPYPINTPFPLPLWSSLFRFQPEDKPATALPEAAAD